MTTSGTPSDGELVQEVLGIAAYLRAIQRQCDDYPLVEAAARITALSAQVAELERELATMTEAAKQAVKK